MEDKTFNTIRVKSNKNASKNNGSIVTNGGMYVDRDIICSGNIEVNNIKCFGDILCPMSFRSDNRNIHFSKNLIPEIHNNHSNNITIGTFDKPWECIYANNGNINTIDVDKMHVEKYACLGINNLGNPMIQVNTAKSETDTICKGLPDKTKSYVMDKIQVETDIIIPNKINISFYNDSGYVKIPIKHKWVNYEYNYIIAPINEMKIQTSDIPNSNEPLNEPLNEQLIEQSCTPEIDKTDKIEKIEFIYVDCSIYFIEMKETKFSNIIILNKVPVDTCVTFYFVENGSKKEVEIDVIIVRNDKRISISSESHKLKIHIIKCRNNCDGSLIDDEQIIVF
jgi:hypothetical protein